METQTENQIESSNHKVVISIVILAIVIAGGLMARSYLVKEEPETEWSKPVTADRGEIIKGFPQELIVTPDSLVTSSYKVDLKSGETSHIVTLETSETYKSAYFRYVDFLNKNGYTITSRPFYIDRASISSTKGADHFDIQLSTMSQGRSRLHLIWTTKPQ